MNYQDDLQIDINALHEEWLKQPVLYMKYAELAVQAQKERDKAKENLEVVRATLDRAMRKEPGNYGLDKVTESALSATIVSHPDYLRANDALIEANYKLNLYDAAIKAFEHKKKALENQVQLWTMGYFSIPKDKSSGGFEKTAQDQVVDNQREQLRRRRRS